MSSRSKTSSVLVNPPRALAMSEATEGFSAMTSALSIEARIIGADLATAQIFFQESLAENIYK